jgi:hypothetical protein
MSIIYVRAINCSTSSLTARWLAIQTFEAVRTVGGTEQDAHFHRRRQRGLVDVSFHNWTRCCRQRLWFREFSSVTIENQRCQMFESGMITYHWMFYWILNIIAIDFSDNVVYGFVSHMQISRASEVAPSTLLDLWTTSLFSGKKRFSHLQKCETPDLDSQNCEQLKSLRFRHVPRSSKYIR